MAAVPRDPLIELAEPVGPQRGKPALPIGSHRYEAGLVKDAQVPRDAGLVDTSLLDDVIHLPLADEQRLDDTAASRVGESLEGIYMHAGAYAYRRMPAPSMLISSAHPRLAGV